MSAAGASSSPAPPEEPLNAAKDTPGSSSQSHEDSTSSETSSKLSGWLQRTHQMWLQGKGMLLVLLAQFFGATMNVVARLLEQDGPHGKGMTPFHILLARMPATALFSFIYMWYMKVPEPFGARAVRPLLILRGISGFIGVLSLYYSLIYLPLSEATVLTFLCPIASCYVASFIMPNEKFTRSQQLAGVISILGVILIARPAALFPKDPHAKETTDLHASTLLFDNTVKDPSTKQHLIAVGAGLVGVMGATSAYTIIRKIGPRAHPLVSVNYFALLTSVMCLLAVLVIPGAELRMPANINELLLLLALGLCGFLFQYLVTAGLSYVPPKIDGKPSTHGSSATSMLYLQIVFALFYDKVVWNTTPSSTSLLGSTVILLSALYVALAAGKSKKKDTSSQTKPAETQNTNGNHDIEDHQALPKPWKARDRASASEGETEALLGQHRND
ncbi:hypothetical protein H112_05124 [Trichophyton rubrum D6]|uniref:EamA domain-containing protein n=4 Tax=Trichophyton TaxID=5550 RepID=A0A178ENZ5_TRIRU|nr:uncharacterized protein TERG_02876 [Trichophyton rubrum CBS 118892]EZF21956.1 hypothetical protein H100_05147 [Trichophyton rubrum MR850]EZF40945.1 hypothetical protein H102_05133 [Trichophyton rubrum CBS 100081]EZF51631.1 hypothetical protein H103_05134 [Trichophyton rubrum CBS 288.86]EZF62167.1 hypothetical protein H104_05128 [Trichophyton rubrum CBS 289.86]EZF72877.1 hypothetical protein H105_05154 [Trichophyton soudanense CBS 452.61]EZF83591.1 hypothetical protein H110_05133 [Trichophy